MSDLAPNYQFQNSHEPVWACKFTDESMNKLAAASDVIVISDVQEDGEVVGQVLTLYPDGPHTRCPNIDDWIVIYAGGTVASFGPVEFNETFEPYSHIKVVWPRPHSEQNA